MKAKQVTILRTDLNIRKGKMVSQGQHGSLGSYFEAQKMLEFFREELGKCFHERGEKELLKSLDPLDLMGAFKTWMDDRNEFTKITLGIDSEENLVTIYEQASEKLLPCYLVTDLGLTEFDGVKTKTAVCIGPAWDRDIDPITKHLKLL